MTKPSRERVDIYFTDGITLSASRYKTQWTPDNINVILSAHASHMVVKGEVAEWRSAAKSLGEQVHLCAAPKLGMVEVSPHRQPKLP